MGKVVNTTKTPTSYNSVTQTPPNYSNNNYYISMLQHKINADWNLRPNRVIIEQETGVGTETFFPLEAVIQTVRNDKGEKVSDDLKKLVFQDMQYFVKLGTRFRFSYNFDLSEPDREKDIWITTNKDSSVFTAHSVISRCNGNIGSIYVKENGETEYHYEPVINATDLSSVSLSYSSTIILPQSQLIIIAQYNQYTAQYNINDRFIVGPDKVYKVKAINKFDSLKAYNVEDIPTITMYLDLDEISSRDNFDLRIAYNDGDEVTPVPTPEIVDDYTFGITAPIPIPTELFETPIEFQAYLFKNGVLVSQAIEVECTLEGATNPEDYYGLTLINANTFSIYRKTLYNRSLLSVKCFVSADNSPNGVEMSQSFEISLRGLS